MVINSFGWVELLKRKYRIAQLIGGMHGDSVSSLFLCGGVV